MALERQLECWRGLSKDDLIASSHLIDYRSKFERLPVNTTFEGVGIQLSVSSCSDECFVVIEETH